MKKRVLSRNGLETLLYINVLANLMMIKFNGFSVPAFVCTTLSVAIMVQASGMKG